MLKEILTISNKFRAKAPFIGKKLAGVFYQLLILNYNYVRVNLIKILRLKAVLKNDGYIGLPCPENVLNKPYLFVLSTGRCGTGLVTRILSASPLIWCEHNPKPELEYVSSLIHRARPSIDSLKFAILASRFDLFFVESYLRGQIYAETNNRISFFAPALAELLPNARFIHLVRNPADFVRSGMRRQYYAQGVVQHQRLTGVEGVNWAQKSRLEKIAMEWNEINSQIEGFKQNIDESRILTVFSEDLYSNIEITTNIWKFLELANPFDGSSGTKRIKRILAKPINRQTSGKFPKYKHWSCEQKQQLWENATLGKVYGYTPSKYR